MKDTHDEKVDRQLRRYFRQEMPDPWPSFNYPTTPRPDGVGTSQPMLSWARCVVAVCLALFFAVYLGLAGAFRPANDRPDVNRNDMIGKKDKAGTHRPANGLDVVPMPMQK